MRMRWGYCIQKATHRRKRNNRPANVFVQDQGHVGCLIGYWAHIFYVLSGHRLLHVDIDRGRRISGGRGKQSVRSTLRVFDMWSRRWWHLGELGRILFENDVEDEDHRDDSKSHSGIHVGVGGAHEQHQHTVDHWEGKLRQEVHRV